MCSLLYLHYGRFLFIIAGSIDSFQTPVVVDSDHMAKELDLTSPNDHLYESEVNIASASKYF